LADAIRMAHRINNNNLNAVHRASAKYKLGVNLQK